MEAKIIDRHRKNKRKKEREGGREGEKRKIFFLTFFLSSRRFCGLFRLSGGSCRSCWGSTRGTQGRK